MIEREEQPFGEKAVFLSRLGKRLNPTAVNKLVGLLGIRIPEPLEREYGLNLITTAPSVRYRVMNAAGEVLARARAAGVTDVLVPAIGPSGWDGLLAMARATPPPRCCWISRVRNCFTPAAVKSTVRAW